MAYETYTQPSSGTVTVGSNEIMATPKVVSALQELADAAHMLAKTSESALYARNELSNAQARYAAAADVVAKEREQAGV